MRILLFDNTQMAVRSGGFFCAKGTGEFAAELVRLGNDVTMYGQQLDDPSSTSSFDILGGGVKVAGLKRYRSKIVSYLLLYLVALKYIIKADFVYIFYPTSYRYIPFFCSLFRTKYGLYVRGDEGVDTKLAKRLYRKAHVVFTVAQLFTDLVNSASKKNNGYTIRPMISYTDKDVVKGRSYCPKDKYEILFLCRIQKEKGVLELLDAIKELKDSDVRNLHLSIVGGGPYLEETKNIVKEYLLTDMVSVEGPVDDEERKKKYFVESDIYILPTYYREGFPRTLYEAMVFGTPVITTFVSGIPSLMVDGTNCKRIEERSVSSIKESLSYAINNYKEMGCLAKHATDTVSKVLDPCRPSHAQDVNNAINR